MKMMGWWTCQNIYPYIGDGGGGGGGGGEAFYIYEKCLKSNTNTVIVKRGIMDETKRDLG